MTAIDLSGLGHLFGSMANVSSGALLALAQDAAAVEEEEGGVSTVLQWLNDGGWVMYVILGLSIVAALFFLVRAFDLFILKRMSLRSYLGALVGHIENRRFRQALDVCQTRKSHPLALVARAGLLKANRRDTDIERAMENEMLASVPALQKGIALMALLANVSTLLGLLGTIFGLMDAFSAVASASAAERQNALASGIKVAMYTTAYGIVVAVPLLFSHHILARRAERVQADVEAGASAVLVALTSIPREDREAASTNPTP